jgi:hypothetical protein
LNHNDYTPYLHSVCLPDAVSAQSRTAEVDFTDAR